MKKLKLILTLIFICYSYSLFAKGSNNVLDAISKGNLSLLKQYLIQDSSHYDMPLLGYASNLGQVEIINYLVSQGVDVNRKGWMEMTPLTHLLTPWGWKGEVNSDALIEVVKILIGYGADPNSIDLYGENSVAWAVESGHQKVLSVLLKGGGKTYIAREEVKFLGKDNFYSTALHRACNLGDLEIVKQLIENGAPIDVKDDNGKLPIDVAIARGHSNVVIYLENR